MKDKAKKNKTKNIKGKKEEIKKRKKGNKKAKTLFLLILVIPLVIFVPVYLYTNNLQFKRYLIEITNIFTQKCNIVGTFECRGFKILSSGSLELNLYNPSFDIYEGKLILRDEKNNTYHCSPIKNWKLNSTIKLICNFSKGEIGEKEKIFFTLIYSPKDNPIYITETGVLLSRRE